MMMSASARDERRITNRTAAVLAVGLGSDSKPGRHGVTRDLSANGLLVDFCDAEPLHEGRPREGHPVHSNDGAVDVEGRVARVDENPISSPELWRYRLGIELDAPLPNGIVEIVAKA